MSVLAYSRDEFKRMLEDPEYRRIAEKIRLAGAREAIYYGDKAPDVFEAVVVVDQGGDVLGLYDSSSTGRSMLGKAGGFPKLGVAPMYIVASSLPVSAEVRFYSPQARRGLEDLASLVGVRLSNRVTAFDLKKLYDTLIEKKGY